MRWMMIAGRSGRHPARRGPCAAGAADLRRRIARGRAAGDRPARSPVDSHTFGSMWVTVRNDGQPTQSRYLGAGGRPRLSVRESRATAGRGRRRKHVHAGRPCRRQPDEPGPRHRGDDETDRLREPGASSRSTRSGLRRTLSPRRITEEKLRISEICLADGASSAVSERLGTRLRSSAPVSSAAAGPSSLPAPACRSASSTGCRDPRSPEGFAVARDPRRYGRLGLIDDAAGVRCVRPSSPTRSQRRSRAPATYRNRCWSGPT